MTIIDEEEIAADIDVLNFLEHHGVRGQKWGVRRKQNRALNKASRRKDIDKYDKGIDRARKRVESKAIFSDKGSKSHTAYKTARAQYKKDKQVMGSREAKKILNKAKEKRFNDVATSQQAKSGKETAVVVAVAVGYVAMRALMASKA